MKKIFVIGVLALLLVLLNAKSQTRSVWRTLYAIPDSTDVPTNFVASLGGQTNIYATRVTILGKKSARVNNTSTVYVGSVNTNDAQPYPVTAGGEVILRAADTAPFNLRDWYVDAATSGDGVTIIFQ